MKYLAVILSGMSDRPFRAYDDETPLSAAFKPNIDMLSSRSFSGFVQNIPASFANVCDAAAWSVIGYPPRKYCSGRAAACVCGNGIRLKKDDVAMMCGFVSLTDDEEYENRSMTDYDISDITLEEKKGIMTSLNDALANDVFSFKISKSGETFVFWDKGEEYPGKLYFPKKAFNKPIGEYLPDGQFAFPLYELMKKSADVLKDHPVNIKRLKEGKNKISSIWLWGISKKLTAESFESVYGLKAAAVSSDSYFRGTAKFAGMSVYGASRFARPERTAEKAVKLLEDNDVVFLYIDTPEHAKSFDEKKKLIEKLDKKMVAVVYDKLNKLGTDNRILLTSGHSVPLSAGVPTLEAVPYMIYDSRTAFKGAEHFNENISCEHFFAGGSELMKKFLSQN